MLDFKPSNYNNEKGVPGTLDYITIQDTSSGGEVKKTGNISNGSTISTDYMYFRVSDNTEVKYVVVTKDGVEVPVTFLDQGFNGYEFYLEKAFDEETETYIDEGNLIFTIYGDDVTIIPEPKY